MTQPSITMTELPQPGMLETKIQPVTVAADRVLARFAPHSLRSFRALASSEPIGEIDPHPLVDHNHAFYWGNKLRVVLGYPPMTTEEYVLIQLQAAQAYAASQSR